MNSTLKKHYKSRWWLAVPLVLLLIMLLRLPQAIFAAEVAGGGETYRLASGEVIQDDLYVSAGEVFIDGTIDGDLIAAGGYVEVNGTVTGDLIAAGGGIVVNGTVEDDFRGAGGGISIPGTIGGDLFVAAGGTPFDANIRAFMGTDSPLGSGVDIAQGVQLTGRVGEDAYIFGGRGAIGGAIGGDLFTTMSAVAFSGRVSGNATLRGQNVEINNESRVNGELIYTAAQEIDVAEDVSSSVAFEPESSVVDAAGNPLVETQEEPSFFRRFFNWTWSTLKIIVGLSLLTWLLLRFFPDVVPGTAESIDNDFPRTIVYGVGFALLMIPIAMLLVLLISFFFGGFSGGLPSFFTSTGLLSLLWVISPIFSGFWLGQEIADAVEFDLDEGVDSLRELMIATIAGIIVIVLLARLLALIPCVGGLASWVIYLLSFALAAGGFIRWQQQERVDRATATEATM